jgi:hypothetical protein
MYAAIRQAKAKPGVADELANRIKRGAIPIISSVPGFMGYYVVYAPDDTVTAISVFTRWKEPRNRIDEHWLGSRKIWGRYSSNPSPPRLDR